MNIDTWDATTIDSFGRYVYGVTKLKPEMQLQIALMKWLQTKHPHIYMLTFASAGGLWTSPKQASLMKSSGYKKGTPDLMIAIPCSGYHGCFIEVKADSGKASSEQMLIGKLLAEQGYYAVIRKGWRALITTVEEYCAPVIQSRIQESIDEPVVVLHDHPPKNSPRINYQERIKKAFQEGLINQYKKQGQHY